MTHLAVVSPVYGCTESLDELCRRLHTSLASLTEDYQIVLVNDGSPDDAWERIARLCAEDSRVRGLNLSRNFGQHAAITAGLDYVTAEWVVVMDCDLQDRPEEIPRLYRKALEGYDMVLARRTERQDGFLRRWFSRAFYALLGYLTDTQQDASIANFGIYKKEVVDALCSLGEYRRFIPVMVRWVGFCQATQDVDHAARYNGPSSYDLSRMMRLATDVLISFSDKPLRLTVRLGLIIALVALITAVYIVFMAMAGETKVVGWASVMVSVWFFGGLVVFSVGMVGLYVGRTFDEVKRRPKYIVRNKHGFG